MNNLPCSEKEKRREDVCAETCTSSERCWIERPNYFSGQLLTDADLRAEQDYFIEKNRLHNRYLHGWGVVCGLKVKCYPCCSGHGSSGKVVVEPGYAIDCCGNDIVVCNEEEFDVVQRIRDLEKKKGDPCSPAAGSAPAPCPDKEEKYYLVIKYKEEDAKPATALKAGDGCTVQRCVPSRTRECHEFDLIEHCTLKKRAGDDFLKRTKECSDTFVQVWRKLFGADGPQSVEDVKSFTREYHKALPDHLRCSILDELEDIRIDDIDVSITNAAALSSNPDVSRLYAILFYLLLDCLCQALHNPCPECSKDDLVILATITIKNGRIDRICNLSRRWVVTFPTLFYWLPLNRMVGDLVEKICCELDLARPGSYAPWVYMTRLVENGFALPDTIAGNLREAFNTLPRSLIQTLDPERVSLKEALNKKSLDSKALLEEMNIEVVGKERYEPSLGDFSLERIVSTVPYARPGSRVIQLVDDEDNVIGFRTVKKEEAPPGPELADLRKEVEEIKANISVMKAHLRRDVGSIIKTRLAVKEDYRPLTIELTRSLTKEMPPEVLKGVEDVRGGRMKRANIRSVHHVVEAVPADVSDALKEPVENALKYIDNAEEVTVDVARKIAAELEKEKITEKKDLKRLDTKRIAAKLGISERRVKDAIRKIT